MVANRVEDREEEEERRRYRGLARGGIPNITSGGCQVSTSSLCTSINDEYHDSNARANSDLETYILQLAAKKAKLSKKALRRVLKSRNIEFNDSKNIGEL